MTNSSHNDNPGSNAPNDTKPAAGTFRTLTEDAFVEQYKPEQLEDGSYYRQRDWTDPVDVIEIERAATENRCWTALDCDGQFVFSSGKHFVNRLYYVICAVPVAAGEHIEVPDDVTPDDGDAATDS